MGDDSDRADRESGPDAGADDSDPSGGGDPESDPLADDESDAGIESEPAPDAADDESDANAATTETDAAAPDTDTDDRDSSASVENANEVAESDTPTEVDAAETVDRLRATDADAEADETTETEASPGGPGADEHAGDGDGSDADNPTTDGESAGTEPQSSGDADDSDAQPSGTDSDTPDAKPSGDANNSRSPDDDPAPEDSPGDGSGDATDDSGEIWPDDDSPPANAAEVTGTDGGTPATVGDDPGTAGATDSLVDEGIASEGPESDEEMPLAAHIEEMIHRLAVVLGIGGIITLLLYPGADLANSAFGLDLVSSTQVIDFLWNTHVPGAPELTDRRPRVYGPLELLLTELKVAALGGLVVGLPVFVYETYLFMRPGLYPKERRYYLAAVPTSIVLAFVGISFAHFLVLPAIFAYFTSYTTGTAIVAFGLKETFNLILILMGYNAIIFQIPLFIMLAIMMNLVTRRWLEARRLLFWGAFLGLAFLISPDPTGMAPIIIAATMIALFEGTLFALRWTSSGSLTPTAERLSARRPQAVVVAALVAYLLSSLPAPTGYYALLPRVVVETLAANGLAVYTPVFIAGILVGAFELGGFLLRRYGRSERALRARLAVDTARRPVWVAAAVVGYLGGPDPVALRVVADVSLRPALAGGIGLGLVIAYEAVRLLLAARADRAS